MTVKNLFASKRFYLLLQGLKIEFNSIVNYIVSSVGMCMDGWMDGDSWIVDSSKDGECVCTYVHVCTYIYS